MRDTVMAVELAIGTTSVTDDINAGNILAHLSCAWIHPYRSQLLWQGSFLATSIQLLRLQGQQQLDRIPLGCLGTGAQGAVF